MRVISQRWSILSKRARLFAGAFGAVLLFAVAAGFLVQRDTRIALFAEPLRGEQVAEVADRLAEWNEPFVVAVDNVRVEAKRRNALLLRLSLAQVPHPHLASSSEVLAKASPLTPQAVLDAEQRDGLAGDIAGSLRGLAGVEDARVIIAPAREGAFAGEKSHDATASVRLNLKAGAALSRETLEGIRNFVAAGVPGLNAPHVAILDDRGLTLGEQSPVGTGEAQGLQNSLQSALDAVVGGAATIVRVRVDYDPRNRESHAVVRRPLGSRPVATTSADERYKSPSKQYAKSTTTIDRGSETRDEKIDTPAGRLERISVAVAVDQARHLNIPKIRSLATGTLGLVSSRGDVLSVEEMVFPQTAAVRSLPLAAGLGLAASLAPSLVAALALLAVAYVGAKPAANLAEAVVQRVSLRRTARAVAGFAPAHVRGALQNEPPHTAAAIISALPAATATAVLEMYPPEERAAIVCRMSRAAAPVVPDYESVLRRG